MMEKLSNVEVLKSSLENMINQVEHENFRGCYHIADDLIRVSILYDNADGVMISEVLESLFNQIDYTSRSFDITPDEMTALKISVIKNLRELLTVLESNNYEMTYVILKDIRYTCTKFQFNAFHTLPKKHLPNRVRRD